MLNLPPAFLLSVFPVGHQGSYTMPQQLVVTAIGTDRTGIVSKLARLVTDCNCNITDSRMAIFGGEFTFIMLLSGDPAAISRIEHLLPGLGLELDLTTMTKRTRAHQKKAVAAHYVLEYTGPDRVGTLGAITGLLASRQVYIGSLQSQSKQSVPGQSVMHTLMTLELPAEERPDHIETDIMALLNEMNLTGSFHAQT
jgi:glycine cleavage system transcriptional repressor